MNERTQFAEDTRGLVIDEHAVPRSDDPESSSPTTTASTLQGSNCWPGL
jgi:hypothetical protein